MNPKAIDFLVSNNIDYVVDAPMSLYSSVRIGAAAALTVFPSNQQQLIALLRFLSDSGISYRLVGRMTNILPSDDYYDGALISTRNMNRIEIDKDCLTADCGATLPKLIHTAAEHCLGGAEALSGIPGTLGGALYSNAGAFGSEISDFFLEARVYNPIRKTTYSLGKSELTFGYRCSSLKGSGLILLSAKLAFFHDSRENIKSKIGEVKKKRLFSQPQEHPSLGSVFKKCGNTSAALLIDRCGLKGRSVGGASVSLKHAGFIINTGGASAKDFADLISIVKREVYEKFSVRLEEEIEYF